MKRRLTVVAGLLAASLIGVGTAVAVSDQQAEPDPPKALTPADCLTGQMSSGSPTYTEPIDETQVDSSTPEELASRFIEDTNFREMYPDAQIVSTYSTDAEEVIALASGVLIVGQLEFLKTPVGWHYENISICYGGSRK